MFYRFWEVFSGKFVTSPAMCVRMTLWTLENWFQILAGYNHEPQEVKRPNTNRAPAPRLNIILGQ